MQIILIQYVPDAVRQERVNVGVAVLTNDGFRIAFADSFQRAELFADHKLPVLTDLRETAKNWTVEDLRRLYITTGPLSSIQFVSGGSSILDLDEGIADAKRRYLD